MSAIASNRDFTCRIEDSMRLINRVAFKVWRRMKAAGSRHVEIEEIRSELCIAWCEARDRFNPELGVPFPAYLTRGLYLHINRYVKNHMEEITNQNRSVVEADGVPFGDESLNLFEIIPNGDETIDQTLIRVEFFEEVKKRVSETTRMFLNLLVNTPPEILEEYQALDARIKFARSRGYALSAPPNRLSISFVLDFMQVERKDRRKILVEIEQAVSRVSKRLK
jgi:hypothetical protein